GGAPAADPGLFHLTACSWIPIELKPQIVTESVWRAAERDETLTSHYREQWSLAAAEPGAQDPLEATLRLHRRINLTGLLRRLDSATMLASVEGRTPFADRDIASLCAAIPLHDKYRSTTGANRGGHREPETKIPLRRAMTGRLP